VLGFAIGLLPAASSGADAFVVQGGSGGRVSIEQVQGGVVTVQQTGANNRLEVLQRDARSDVADVVQGGAANEARLQQQGTAAGALPRQAVVRQGGSGGRIELQQLGPGASGALFQSILSIGARAQIFQGAAAPLAVIEQGVAWTTPASPDARAQSVLVRSGTLATAASTAASASIVQSGGSGLSGIIIQAGAAQSASIRQSGSYLEADIVQNGAAHTASIVQAGNGSAASPYRASIVQFGAQPQSFSVTQTAGAAPRVIRVIQQ